MDAVNLKLVKAPHLSLVMLLSARTGRTAHLARTAAGRAGLVALPPVMACAQRAYPDTAVTPIPPSADVSVPEQVARLRDLPDDAVIDDLARTFGPLLPTVWRPPADHPRAWLRSYASATSSAWSAVSPRWRSAEPLLALEARRVGAAVVRGCTDVLLNTLHPRIRYVDGEIRVPAARDQSVDLAGRRLVLVPTLAGPGGRLVGFDLPDVVYVAYPLPGQSTSAPPRATDPLTHLLGHHRAALLQAAGRPITMTHLAATVGCTLRMTSYHCKYLESAGLIHRERLGQTTHITRTPRGHELLDLFRD